MRGQENIRKKLEQRVSREEFV